MPKYAAKPFDRDGMEQFGHNAVVADGRRD